MGWLYADKDPAALAEMEARIAKAGQHGDYITYSDLVKGIVFHLSNVNNGLPYCIDVHNWTGFDRKLVGDFLGYISERSYEAHHFLASALVVNRSEHKPNKDFLKYLGELHGHPITDEIAQLEAWKEESDKAHGWYKAHGWG